MSSQAKKLKEAFSSIEELTLAMENIGVKMVYFIIRSKHWDT